MEKKKSIEVNFRENFDDQERLHFILSTIKRSKKKNKDKLKITPITIYLLLTIFTVVCIIFSIMKISPFTFLLIITLSINYIYLEKKKGKEEEYSNIKN
ncbi:MAG: hypothetical protein ACFFEY_19845 [Candidatus Thorarchaeota archaeon]